MNTTILQPIDPLAEAILAMPPEELSAALRAEGIDPELLRAKLQARLESMRRAAEEPPLVSAVRSAADAYAADVTAAARKAGLRVDADLRNEKINYKVREHSLAKVPVLLVVGKKEAETRQVSIRRLGSDKNEVMNLDDALKLLTEEALPPDVKRERAAG